MQQHFKLRVRREPGHTVLTFFLSKGRNFTYANCGDVVLHHEDASDVLLKIHADEIRYETYSSESGVVETDANFSPLVQSRRPLNEVKA